MAITNAQQAKQIMNEGGPMRKIKGQDHMLAYITPSEKDILVELGGQETMTPEGILAYPPEGNYGSEAKGPGSGPGKSGITGMASTGGANFSSGNNVGNVGSSTGPKGTGKVSPPTTVIGGEEYPVLVNDLENIKKRQEAEERAAAQREREKDKFITTDNTPNYLPGYLKFLAGNNSVNRKFFYDKVVAAGKIPGLNYGEDALEQAYQDYMNNRMAGKTDAYGNPTQGFSYDIDETGKYDLTGNFIDDRDDGAGQQNLLEDTTGDTEEEEEDEVNPRDYTGLAPRFMGSSFDFTGLAEGGIARAGAMDGGRMRQMEMMQDEDDPTGGIMDLESGRQMYFLGKLVKKATRAVKKVVKSPIGKAALLYFGAGALGNLAGGSGLGGMFKGAMSPSKFLTRSKLGNIFTKDGAKNILFGGQKLMGNPAKNNFVDFSGILGSGGKSSLGKTLGLSFGLPFALDALGVGKEEEDGFDLDKYYKTQGIDIDAIRNNPYRFLSPSIIGSNYQTGTQGRKDGGRMGYAEGSKEPVAKETMPLLDMDGMEKDYREDGGFVPIGRMERADDVPARLSKNEFVFTADAVRNAGEGDIDKGAEVMYNMMKNLESGGEVSEESQGLDGAREMFKTSQRLEEIL